MKLKLIVCIVLLAITTTAYTQSYDCYDKQMTKVKALYEQKRFSAALTELNKVEICTNKRSTADMVDWRRKLDDSIKIQQTKNGYYANIGDREFGVYTGYYKNNLRSGKGKMIYYNGDKYDGDWDNDLRNGKGTLLYKNGDKYDGEWMNDQKQGKGKLTQMDHAVYEGDWKKGEIVYGTYNSADSFAYKGSFRNDNFNGWGKYTSKKGHAYEGEFSDGKKNGWGNYIWPDGSKFTGQWVNDVRTGIGISTLNVSSSIRNSPGTKMYCGFYKEDKKEGFGRCYDKDQRLIYEGEFKADAPVDKFPNIDLTVKPNSSRQKKNVFSNGYYIVQEFVNNLLDGKSDKYYENSDKYSGEWHNGVYEGQGKLSDRDGSYSGGFKGGSFYGWGTRTWKNNDTYEGEFNLNGNLNGWAKIIVVTDAVKKKGYIYEGGYVSNLSVSGGDGFGKVYDPAGIKNCSNCTTYAGELKGGKKSGKGRCYDTNMNLLYDGYFANDAPVGTYPNQ